MDRDSVPLPGVTVKMKGTTIGTASDMHGKFELVIPEAQKVVLVFTFIGMKQIEREVKVGLPINVVMEEDVATLQPTF